MGVTFRAMTVAAVGVVVSISNPVSLSAQKATRSGPPETGTWGGEVSIGDIRSASLLKFLSPQWAVLAGASVSSFKTRSDGGDLILENRFTQASLQVGARRYGGRGLGVRPVAGLGVVVSGGSGNASAVGAYGELGAVYFFTPHVSLGAIGTANVSRGEGGSSSFGASLARLIGAVYF